MTDDDDRIVSLVALCDASQTLPRPVRHIDEPFSAWNLQFSRRRSPAHEEFGILLFDFAKGQTFELAMIELADVIFD